MVTFGEPYEAANGSVIITVSRTARGGRSRALGIYTVTAGGTTWSPAVDSGRIALLGAATGFVAALLSTLAVARRPPWPELTERVMLANAQVQRARR